MQFRTSSFATIFVAMLMTQQRKYSDEADGELVKLSLFRQPFSLCQANEVHALVLELSNRHDASGITVRHEEGEKRAGNSAALPSLRASAVLVPRAVGAPRRRRAIRRQPRRTERPEAGNAGCYQQASGATGTGPWDGTVKEKNNYLIACS